MIIGWAVSSFNFYLVMYLANTFERVYVTALFLSLADIAAYVIGGILVREFGAKFTLTYSFMISTIGGILVLSYGLQH